MLQIFLGEEKKSESQFPKWNNSLFLNTNDPSKSSD